MSAVSASDHAPEASARSVRSLIVEHGFRAGSGHLGSSLSSVEIIIALLLEAKASAGDSTKLVLSKGHAALGLYCALAEFGLLDTAVLKSYGRNGSLLGGHVSKIDLPGAEVATGALGHGLSVGLGMALAGHTVRVVLGDGECDEGSVWEAASLAHKLSARKLAAVVDANGIQGLEPRYTSPSDLADRWRSFGWASWCIDGHDAGQLVEFLRFARSARSPSCAVAVTTKGKGVTFMEGSIEWHYKHLTASELSIAQRDLTP